MPFSQPAEMVIPERRWKLAIWSFALLWACAAGYLFFLCTLPFDTLRSVALSAVPPGYSDRFTLDLYFRIVDGLRLLASLLCVLAVAPVIFTGWLSRFLKRAWGDVQVLLIDAIRNLAALRFDPLHLVVLLAVFLAAVLIRLTFLGEPIRNDEAYTFMYYASRPIYVAATYYTANNHILNTLLMHLSTSIFGASVWSVRLPTFLVGSLLIPVIYAATRLYHGKNAALIAAALTSASSPLIEYSFNARGYSLGALFFLLMILLVGLLEQQEKGAWYLLPLVASLSLYSVPTMVYGVGGVFLYLLLRRLDFRKTFLAMVCTGLATLVLYSPVLFTVGPGAITDNRWVVPIPRGMWSVQFAREMTSLWIYWNLDLPKLIALLLVLGIVASFLSLRNLRVPPLAIIFCVMFVAGVLLPIQRLVPFRRTWLFLLPLCFASAAIGFDFLIRKLKSKNLVAAMLATVLAAWMSGTVLTGKSLRHSGIESVGGRGAKEIVLAMKDRLLLGDQFICSDSFDPPLDFEMYLHKVPYHPTPDGNLLIVTPAGQTPQRTLARARIPSEEVISIRKLGHFEDEDVYLGVRGPGLAFNPVGDTWMGEFKTTRP